MHMGTFIATGVLNPPVRVFVEMSVCITTASIIDGCGSFNSITPSLPERREEGAEISNLQCQVADF